MEKQDIDITGGKGALFPLPGPIALVTTLDEHGHVNVAPKSWISVITRQPVRLIIGCHREHHTAQNLLSTGECVLNFPADDLAASTWAAHEYRPPGPGELAARGFTPIPSVLVSPPRLLECRAHLECRLESVKWYDAECVLFVEVVAASADAAALAADDPFAYLRPIFFLAPGQYGTIEGTRRPG